MWLTPNTLRPRQNGLHLPDDIFKWIFLNENVWILRLNCHWSLFLGVQWSIFLRWFGYGLASSRWPLQSTKFVFGITSSHPNAFYKPNVKITSPGWNFTCPQWFLPAFGRWPGVNVMGCIIWTNDGLLTHLCITWPRWVNTLRPRQNGRHFPDDIFRCIFLNENV